jgi:hypothetical protein
METPLIVSTIVGAVGGTAYVCAWACKRLGERQFLEYLAYVCHTLLAEGDEIYWEDLERIYARETERLVGSSGRLTEPEAHILVKYLSDLCHTHPPRYARWEIHLRNLRRSLPQNWIIAVGANTYSNLAALLLLLWNISTLKALGGTGPTLTSWWTMAGGSVLTVLMCLAATLQIRMFVTGLRATRKIKRSLGSAYATSAQESVH